MATLLHWRGGAPSVLQRLLLRNVVAKRAQNGPAARCAHAVENRWVRVGQPR
jgi:hypothetical protein